MGVQQLRYTPVHLLHAGGELDKGSRGVRAAILLALREPSYIGTEKFGKITE